METHYADGRKVPQGRGVKPGELEVPQKEYTLPGIMQYLQSQFTLAEKNRMQNDLEKSSLKLRIVELEGERNALKLENEKLKVRVKQLEQDANGAEDTDGTGGCDGSKGVAQLDTVDVDKLVKARQFLKASTSEILYLLKAPCIEQEDPLKLQDQSFFVDPTQRQAGPGAADLASTASLQGDAPRGGKAEYVDMDIPIVKQAGSPVKKDSSANKNGSTDSLPTAETGSDSTVLELSETPTFCALMGSQLYSYLAQSNRIRVFSDPSGEKVTVGEYMCPASFANIVDIKTNGSYVVAACKREVLVFPVSERSKPVIVYPVDGSIVSVDLDSEGKVLLAYGSTVEVLQISSDGEAQFKPVFSADYKEGGKLLASQFVQLGKSYGVAILTQGTLLLQSVIGDKSKAGNGTGSGTSSSDDESTQVVNLSKFDRYLLTSKNLLINLPQGLFLIDFTNLTSFNHVPLKEPLDSDALLGSSRDDCSIFYVVDSGSLELFKVIDTGDIFDIKSVDGVNPEGGWCCAGTINKTFVVCVSDPKGVSVHTV